MTRIHIIDDDVALCELLSEYLQDQGFAVTTSHCGATGLQHAQALAPDLVLLDVMLPGMSGFDCLKKLRQNSPVPVLMLTARGDEIDRVLGLELGADDYVAKPFSHRELAARIRAILRRLESQSPGAGQLLLQPASMEAHFHGQSLSLTAAEFRVLAVLYAQAGEIVTKETLCEEAFGRRLHPFDRHIDIHISHIRKKLADIDERETIKTIRGSGYQLLVRER